MMPWLLDSIPEALRPGFPYTNVGRPWRIRTPTNELKVLWLPSPANRPHERDGRGKAAIQDVHGDALLV
jgi:hypothetical protein